MHGIKQDKHDNNRIDYNFKTEFPDLLAPPSSLITTHSQLLLTTFIFSSSDSYDLTLKKNVFTTLLINIIYYLLLPMAVRFSIPPHFLLSKFIIVLLHLFFLLMTYVIN